MLTQIWFVANGLFVLFLILFLFVHRSLQDALRRGDQRAAGRLRRRRIAVGVLAAAFFAAMVVAFLANMRLNG